jgi:hypothetical protein
MEVVRSIRWSRPRFFTHLSRTFCISDDGGGIDLVPCEQRGRREGEDGCGCGCGGGGARAVYEEMRRIRRRIEKPDQIWAIHRPHANKPKMIQAHELYVGGSVETRSKPTSTRRGTSHTGPPPACRRLAFLSRVRRKNSKREFASSCSVHVT